jgi:hypothetical protein
MVSVELYTPKGVYKGLYHYNRVSVTQLVCWPDGKEPDDGYRLGWTGFNWTCNCMGHAYRRTCAHVEWCPYDKPEVIDATVGPLERGARNAMVRLADGRIVNCYDHFWRQKPGKGD